MKEATEKAGKLINKFIVIDDLLNATVSGIATLVRNMNVFKKLAYIDQLLYPETLAICAMVNSPALFTQPFRMISMFLEPETKNKVFVLGGKQSFGQILDVLFDKESLPTVWGGTLEGNHVPLLSNWQTTYLTKMDEYCKVRASDQNVYSVSHRRNPLETLRLKPLEETELKVTMKKNSVVEWQIAVDAHDVEYSVHVQDHAQGQPKQLQSSKIYASVPRLNGQYVHHMEDDATLVLKFSNKRSSIFGRTLNYRIMHF